MHIRNCFQWLMLIKQVKHCDYKMSAQMLNMIISKSILLNHFFFNLSSHTEADVLNYKCTYLIY